MLTTVPLNEKSAELWRGWQNKSRDI